MIRLFLKVNGAVRWESTLSRALEKIDVDKIYMINKEAKTTESNWRHGKLVRVALRCS